MSSYFRCRKCRYVLFDDSSILDEHGNQAFSSDRGVLGTCGSQEKTQWFISYDDDILPPWIQRVIEETSWTKGKLTCPKCGGRLGSFDFLITTQCPCGQARQPPVHVLCNRVDHIPGSPLRHHEQNAGRQNTDLAQGPRKASPGEREGIEDISQNNLQNVNHDLMRTASDDAASSRVPQSLMLQHSCDMENDNVHVNDEHSERVIDELGKSDDDQVVARESRHCVRRRRRRRIILDQDTGSDGAEGDTSSCNTSNRFSLLRAEKSTTQISCEENEGELQDTEVAIPEQLCCPVCLDLFCKPMVCCPCQHTFCEPCLRRLTRERPMWTPCPLCRVPIEKCLKDYKLRYEVKSKYTKEYQDRVRKERKFCNDKYYRLQRCGSPAQFQNGAAYPQLRRRARVKSAVLTAVVVIFGLLICFAFPMLSNASKILDATLITLFDVIGFIF